MLGARKFAIKREQELRVSPKAANGRVFVTLLRTDNGTAEIFGTELAPRRKYAVVKVRRCFVCLGID
jgi:hypothetical protein